MLMPNAKPDGLGAGFALAAAIGLVRALRNLRLVPGLPTRRIAAIRRLSWTLAADLLIAYVAARFLIAGDASAATILMVGIFVLMVGAADISWTMLVEVTTERPTE